MIDRKKISKDVLEYLENTLGQYEEFVTDLNVGQIHQQIDAIIESHSDEEIEEENKKIKEEDILVLDLDDFYYEPFRQTSFDIGGRGHYIEIKAKNKAKAIAEMVKDFKEDLEKSFQIKEIEDEDDF